ncbi:MAG: CHASE3 domain-containing protein [Betaproteobacteria bacterium]
MQRYFDRGMLAVLGVLLAVTVANGVVAYHNIRDLFEARVRVGQSRQVQHALQQVLSLAQDAESAVRGFVITGESAYLEPYDNAMAASPARLQRLLELIGDNPQQQADFATLRARFDAHAEEQATLLAIRREDGFEKARAAIAGGSGRDRMQALRETVSRMTLAETAILDERARASFRSLDIARASSVLAALLGMAMLGVLMYQMRRILLARDRVAASLGEQKELFRTTLASLGEAVLTCDTAGRVTFLNTAAESLTGWSAARAVGQPIDDIVRIVDPRTHAPIENSAQAALREGRGVPIANRGKLVARGARPERPVDDSAAPIRDADGNIAGAVLVIRDITERKRSEDALLDADRRKDEFLAVLAHELRNPLAPLRNALQIVRMAGDNRAAVEQVWGMMERQVQQMVRLIDDLLDVSRITRNKLEMRKEPVQIGDVIEAALEMSSPTVARYGHQVQVDVPAGLPPVDGDRARLVQVVDNLLTNAAKYSEAGGRIQVRAFAAGGEMRIVVKDTGVGIPPDMLERIFDMFTQVDRTLERSRGGLGIGLTLVRRIVELHGGTIAARSEGPGRGSEFEIALPTLARAPVQPQPDEGADIGIATARRILVADDNADAAESLARMLRMMGHEVKTVADGEECLAAFADFQPDVVLLDIGMPRMDGYAAARAIRERWGRRALLVALTGWGQEEDRRRAREAGFDHHFVKPAEYARLARLLHAAPEVQAHA